MSIVKDSDKNNIKDDYGNTPLITLTYQGEYKFLKNMLRVKYHFDKHSQMKCYFDPDIQNDKHGYTALTVACLQNKYKIAKLLIDYGCKINIQDHYGSTPLMYASYNNNYDIVKLLINANCNVNIRNKCGYNALTYACFFGFKKIIKLLVRSGCNLDIRCNKNYTFLMAACCSKKENIVKFLLKNYCIFYSKKELHEKAKKGLKDIESENIDLIVSLFEKLENYQDHLNDVVTQKFVNKYILKAGLIGTCIRYVKKHNKKFDVNGLLSLPKDLRKHIMNYVIKN